MSRNPIARALPRLRHQVIPDKRARGLREFQDEAICESSGNVFADLGMAHADKLKQLADRAESFEQFRAAARALRATYNNTLNEEIPEHLTRLLNDLR